MDVDDMSMNEAADSILRMLKYADEDTFKLAVEGSPFDRVNDLLLYFLSVILTKEMSLERFQDDLEISPVAAGWMYAGLEVTKQIPNTKGDTHEVLKNILDSYFKYLEEVEDE